MCVCVCVCVCVCEREREREREREIVCVCGVAYKTNVSLPKAKLLALATLPEEETVVQGWWLELQVLQITSPTSGLR